MTPIMPRFNPNRPRVQQTAGRMKFRKVSRGVRCLLHFRDALLIVLPVRVEMSLNTRGVHLELRYGESTKLRLKCQNLAVQYDSSGGGFVNFEECFATLT